MQGPIIKKKAFFSMEFSKNKYNKPVKCLKKLSKCSIFSFRWDSVLSLLYSNFKKIECYESISRKIIQSKMQVYLKKKSNWNNLEYCSS